MKASKFTDAQKAFIIRQGEEGTPVEEICRKAGISQATYFNWKWKYAGLMPSEMKRLRELEEENARLKAHSCRSLTRRGDAAGRHQAKALRPVRKRKLVAEMVSGWGVSIRRACGLMKIAPNTYRYRSRRPGQAALETQIKEICAIRVRYGYRRVHVLLRREGWAINAKRVRRIYSSLGLQIRNKSPRRRVKAKLRDDRASATGTHDVWAMDFVHDQLAMGGKIRTLTLLDTYSRYAHAIDARAQYRAENVVATLEAVCSKVGCPKAIRVDQGSEFVSRDLDLWAYAHNVTLDFSRPGKPTDNAFIEAFNGRLRAECLNVHWFMTLSDAREKLECWRRAYNEVRPHGALGNKVPISLLNSAGDPNPPVAKQLENSSSE